MSKSAVIVMSSMAGVAVTLIGCGGGETTTAAPAPAPAHVVPLVCNEDDAGKVATALEDCTPLTSTSDCLKDGKLDPTCLLNCVQEKAQVPEKCTEKVTKVVQCVSGKTEGPAPESCDTECMCKDCELEGLAAPGETNWISMICHPAPAPGPPIDVGAGCAAIDYQKFQDATVERCIQSSCVPAEDGKIDGVCVQRCMEDAGVDTDCAAALTLFKECVEQNNGNFCLLNPNCMCTTCSLKDIIKPEEANPCHFMPPGATAQSSALTV